MSGPAAPTDAPPAPPATASPGSIEGRRCRLRPVEERDVEPLRALASAPAVGDGWRYRGGTPGPDQFRADLWRGVLVQYAVEDRRTGDLVGLVTAFAANFRDAHAHLAVLLAPAAQRQGWPIEALGLFVEHLFTTFDLRKLYGQIHERNLALFASGQGRIFREEVRLTDHEFSAGRYWDAVIVAIDRSSWLDPDNRLVSIFRAQRARQGAVAAGDGASSEPKGA